MGRIARLFTAALLLAGPAGCCADAERFYENAYGFNNPEIDHYSPGPPAPVTTPPGFSAPAPESVPSDLLPSGV